MRRIPCLLTLALGLIPASSRAIQLHWSSGATNLNVTTAVRCTLVVEADTQEQRLPAEWQLLWVTNGTLVQPIALGSQAACGDPTAQVSEFDLPTTAADSAANRTTAHFCSTHGLAASSGWYLIDLAGDSREKFKIVALNPSDTTQVIESNEVMFNGGIDGDYTPTVLSTAVSHESISLTVTAAGTGLSSVRSASVVAPAFGSVGLQIVQKSDNAITVAGSVDQPLTSAVLQLSSVGSAATEVLLAADSVVAVDNTLAGNCVFNECYYTDPNSNVYPKDFAFILAQAPNPWHWLFHLYYIRHFISGVPDAQNEIVLAHTWSRDLRTWSVPTTFTEFTTGTVGWDKGHVWAPSIVHHDSLYYMFYTGVDSVGNQSSGYATTAVLDTSNTVWTRYKTSSFTTASAPSWAYTGASQQQCRDPFVMADPDSAGRLLMLYSAQSAAAPHDFAVGLARNKPGTFNSWFDLGYYPSTSLPASGNGYTVESSMVFPDSIHASPDSSHTAVWRLMFTHGIDAGGDSTIRVTTKLTPGYGGVDNTALAAWTSPSQWFWKYLDGDSTVWGSYATEHLTTDIGDFIATFDGPPMNSIRVSRMYWSGTDFYLRRPVVTAVSNQPSGPVLQSSVRVLGKTIGASTVTFEIGLSAAGHARLAVYDVAGRRVRVVADRALASGRTKVAWDGRDASGASVPSGVYFARLTGAFQSRVARVPLVR